MKKVAVVLHGYPTEVEQSAPISNMLRDCGYEVIVPKYMRCTEEFSIEWLKKEIIRLLKGRNPTVLVGVSLGGLMLAKIAQEYPQAKLLFVATGTRFKPKLKLAEKAVKLACHKHGEKVAAWITKMPDKALRRAYDLVHKPKTPQEKEFCEKDKQAIISTLKGVDPKIHGQLAKFLLETDNRELIKKLRNKTLVVSGSCDSLMPLEVGEELVKGVNRKLKVVEAEHFNLLCQQEAMAEIKTFLND